MPKVLKKRILIVEDVDSMRELLKTVVNGILGVEVSGAVGSTREALLQVRRSRPDLVLLDEILPGESSLDLLEILVQEGISVLLITGVEHPVHPLPSGALGRLVKPGWRSLAEDQSRFEAEIFGALAAVGDQVFPY